MKIQKRSAGLLVLVFVCAAALTGCFGRTKPPYMVEQYTLDYTAPAGTQQNPVQELITVERFSVAPQFNSTSMMIRAGQYRFDTYDYSRWYVNPADLVTGFILRDITRSGMFKGTYSYYDTELSRYILEGYIEEFGESTDGKAHVSIRITLLDTSRKNPAEQILFQKQYTESASLSDHSANGLAAGLSEAVKNLSARLLADVSLVANKNK